MVLELHVVSHQRPCYIHLKWIINEHHPLRFYAEKPTWFDRYSI